MKITILGLTITSSWGNGHATTYRSLCRALSRRGHLIEFIEKDVEWYASNRDLDSPDYCHVSLYKDWEIDGRRMSCQLASDADVVIIGSYFPDAVKATKALLDQGTVSLTFYDIDTPITLAGLRSQGRVAYLEADLIPSYCAYMSFTGGPSLQELESRFGSPFAAPLYCSVDPSIYRSEPVHPDYRCDLSYLATYAPDRQHKLDNLLMQAARQTPHQKFLVAGPMYPKSIEWAPNIRLLCHVPPAEHPAFYSSARFSLNLTREEMVSAGHSPSVRLFEASACGAAILSDAWPGLEEFFTAGEEIVIVTNTDDVIRIMHDLPDSERTRIGQRARDRILASHTSDHRAHEFERIVEQMSSRAGRKALID